MNPQVLKDLYTAFATAAPLFTAAGLPPVALLDRYRNQPLEPEQFEYFPVPAIFIGRATQWQRSGNCWNGDLMLDFHLVYDATGETDSLSTNLNDALRYYEWERLVRRVLDGVKLEPLGGLERYADRDVDTGITTYTVLSYRAIYYDDDAAQAALGQATPQALNVQDARVVKLIK